MKRTCGNVSVWIAAEIKALIELSHAILSAWLLFLRGPEESIAGIVISRFDCRRPSSREKWPSKRRESVPQKSSVQECFLQDAGPAMKKQFIR